MTSFNSYQASDCSLSSFASNRSFAPIHTSRVPYDSPRMFPLPVMPPPPLPSPNTRKKPPRPRHAPAASRRVYKELAELTACMARAKKTTENRQDRVMTMVSVDSLQFEPNTQIGLAHETSSRDFEPISQFASVCESSRN